MTHREIPYPKTDSEFEIHATFWSGLVERGFDARACVRGGYGDSVFDIVIFYPQKKPRLIFEVKREKTRYVPRGRDAKWLIAKTAKEQQQLRRYDGYGVEVRVVRGMRHALRLLRGEFSQVDLQERQKP